MIALAAIPSAALLPSTALYGSPPRRLPMRVCMRTGFQIAGVDVAAAGVIPFMRRRDGVYYLMQSHENGTRAGLLSDFGGKREEDDVDAYYTAARELAEETGSVFGTAEALASRLRRESPARVLKRSGRYVTFLLEVPFVHEARLSAVDHTASEGATARHCLWLRPDEVIGEMERGHVLQRLLVRARQGRAVEAAGLQRELLLQAAAEREAAEADTLERLEESLSRPGRRRGLVRFRLQATQRLWRRKAARRRRAAEFGP